ncbi:MAG TPA: hypothetical protein VFO16_23890, partial [Pseudonocardiaceae bacterium]|nr:hypothetical protein [Pseudonocardiaceae bacterium]
MTVRLALVSPSSELEDLLGARGVRDVLGHLNVFRRAEHHRHGGADLLGRDALLRQRPASQTLGLDEQAKHEMLGADKVVTSGPGFFLAGDDDATRPLGEPGEAVEH